MSREVTNYKGFKLVSAHYQGRYQGKAWGNKLACEVAHVYGSSLEDVRAKLQQAIDSGETQEKVKHLLLERHGEFLKRKNIPAEELGAIRLNRVFEKLNRKPHCYECSSSLDNEIDLECSRCGWIVCSCGACGCGHPKYGPQISARLSSKNPKFAQPQETQKNSDEQFQFGSIAEAKRVAMEHPGSKLIRNAKGVWVVMLKNP